MVQIVKSFSFSLREKLKGSKYKLVVDTYCYSSNYYIYKKGFFGKKIATYDIWSKEWKVVHDYVSVDEAQEIEKLTDIPVTIYR